MNAETNEVDDIVEVLPDPLLNMRRWLLWKESPHPKNPKKTRKTPFYVSGTPRHGLLDTEADLAQLVPLDEAMDAYMLGGYTGLGFALSGDGVGAFDLDWILDDDGDLIKAHAGYVLAVKAKELGCYMEISPSGRGLRIVGPISQSFPAYSSGGLEWWSYKRFITLTGTLWANPRGWVSLDELRASLGDPQNDTRDDGDDNDVIITPRLVAELRSALECMDSDERELWIKIGLALKTLGAKGRELWMEWSAKSDKFDRADAARVWSSFRPQQTNHKAVFAEAQREWGWQNPRGREDTLSEDDGEDETPVTTIDDRIDLSNLDVLYPTEFIIDGFLPVGVSVIAGAWGAGKSTNLIPLLASACHLTPEDWGFWPTLRRKVIWITEAPEQARDTLYSLARAEGAAPVSQFAEWFILFRAHRLPAKKLAKMIRGLIDECTYSLDNGFEVNPVIVLDTTAANIDIENESDNSMVSQAMAILKQTLPGISLVLVGHTPKALVKANVSDMTFRGAGAWEADSVATYFLIHDAETDMRYLAIRKARFTPSFREVDFSHEGGSKIIDTPWGEPQTKTYLHGVPTKSDGSQRRQVQDEAREERRQAAHERTLTDRQQRIMSYVAAEAEAGRPVTRADIKRAVGGKAELVIEATTRLLENGNLATHPWDVAILGVTRSGDDRPLILPAEVDLTLFLQRAAAN